MNLKRGIDYGDSNQSDETPSAKRHKELEPSSYALWEIQQMHFEIRKDIHREFLGEQEQKFRKKLTATVKKEMRREAKLDLELENKVHLDLEIKLEKAKFKREKCEEFKDLTDALVLERKKTKDLEARLAAAEKVIEEMKEAAVEEEETVSEKE